ncbi:uncharacterized protein A4U43_C08F3640 [Asparagus officinalis]|nr:uncharacterized protein A4U43_C08F3640 [Asparagus officinalis]
MFLKASSGSADQDRLIGKHQELLTPSPYIHRTIIVYDSHLCWFVDLDRSPSCNHIFKILTSIESVRKFVVLQIIPLHRNPSIRRNPTCLGNWKRLLIPGFILRPGVIFRRKKEKKMTVKKMSDSMGNTMHLIAKNIRAEKQQGFVKKLLSNFRRRK